MKKIEKEFEQIGGLIEHNRNATIGAVNRAGLFTYWQVGGFVSNKLKSGEWGSKVVDDLVDFLKTRHPGLKGYGRRHIYNMVKFYETYHASEYCAVSKRLKLDEFVQSPIAQLSNDAVPTVQSPIAQLSKSGEYRRQLIPEEVMRRSLEEYCAFWKQEGMLMKGSAH